MFSVVMGQMQEEWIRGVYDCGLSRPLLYILFKAGDMSPIPPMPLERHLGKRPYAEGDTFLHRRASIA